MRMSSWRLKSLWPARRHSCPVVQAEFLEDRQLLTVAIQFDYSRDSNHFFEDPARRAILDLAGQTLGSQLLDHLSGIAPGDGNTWSMNFTNPSADRSVTIDNATIDPDTIVVFVGARNISSLAFGGPGGYSSSGSEAWLDLVASRGQPGALENPESDFGPWGGSITFDSGTNWYFGATTEALTAHANDFLSVALHELGHVLGVGTAASWSRYVFDNSFSGPNSMAENDAGPGEVPLADDAHFQEELEEGGQEVAMDPTLLAGTRKNFSALDFAALKDIGWEVGPGGGGTETGGGGGEVPAPETYTINVSSDAAHTIVIRDDSDPT